VSWSFLCLSHSNGRTVDAVRRMLVGLTSGCVWRSGDGGCEVGFGVRSSTAVGGGRVWTRGWGTGDEVRGFYSLTVA